MFDYSSKPCPQCNKECTADDSYWLLGSNGPLHIRCLEDYANVRADLTFEYGFKDESSI